MMGWLSRWLGTDPQIREQKGDTLIGRGNWGPAKIEYETALHHLDNTHPNAVETKSRLEEKLRRSKESLAADHLKSGRDLMEQGYDAEARELLQLALDLTHEKELKCGIRHCLRELDQKALPEPQGTVSTDGGEALSDAPHASADTDDDPFVILCGTLPEPIQAAYLSYGETFKSGYLALNRGDFKEAAELLSRAMEQTETQDSYIPLELATAYMNLGELENARQLLETFVKTHPDLLPGYQLLCEVLWDQGEFGRAESILSQCAMELKNSVAYCLLLGQTLNRAGQHREAEIRYRGFIDKFGWNESIIRALADTYESIDEAAMARSLYAQILDRCTACHTRVDPYIKRRYADISFDLSEYTPALLEIYLALIQEDPENRPHYYRKVSRIYESLGNETEAVRFLSFARQTERERRRTP